MENSINERITHLRKSKNLNQRDFAEKIGITQTSLSMIENGGGVSSKTIRKILDAFKVNSDWLLNGEGEIYASDRKTSQASSIKDELNKLQGFLMGKFGVDTWKEIEPFFPKFEAYHYFSGAY